MRQPTQGPHRGDDTRAVWLMSIQGRGGQFEVFLPIGYTALVNLPIACTLTEAEIRSDAKRYWIPSAGPLSM